MNHNFYFILKINAFDRVFTRPDSAFEKYSCLLNDKIKQIKLFERLFAFFSDA